MKSEVNPQWSLCSLLYVVLSCTDVGFNIFNILCLYDSFNEIYFHIKDEKITGFRKSGAKLI